MTRAYATSLSRTLAVACVATALAACSREPSPEELRAAAAKQWPFVERYCVECHNETELTANIAFDTLSPDEIGAHAETFERAVRKLRGRLMPPPGGRTPEGAETDAAAPALVSPGPGQSSL